MPKKIDDRSNPTESTPQVAFFNQGGFSLLDGAYWLVVVGLAVARHIDITRFAGLTAMEGTWLVIVATGLWILVHVLQRIL